jgi:hypothetical protein
MLGVGRLYNATKYVFPQEDPVTNVLIYRPGRLGRAKPRAGPESCAGCTSSFRRSPVISSGPEASICRHELAPFTATVKTYGHFIIPSC